MNLYEKIQDAMQSDDEDTQEISNDLESLYNDASEEEKKLIDTVFSTLTGWRLQTLLK